MTAPVGGYFTNLKKGVSLRVEDQFTRAASKGGRRCASDTRVHFDEDRSVGTVDDLHDGVSPDAECSQRTTGEVIDVRAVHVEGSRFTHVRVGRFAERAAAVDLLEELTEQGISAALVRDDRPERPIGE